jgi:membrane protease subunit (stomatin/prohibitin family)
MSLLNVIRCDKPQNDYLVWKWQPEKGSQLRQNQIRFGSSLRVRAGEIAVFFYSTGGGASPIDYIEGPADIILETKNLPVIANIIGMAYGGDSPFQAEVYFINMGQATQLKWGVPYFKAFDCNPEFAYLGVPVCANGTITFQISDVKRFVEVQRLENFDPDKLRDLILPQLRTAIKSNIVNLAAARGIPLVQIGGRVGELSDVLLPTASKVLDGYGVALRNFVVEGVEIDETDEGFKKLMMITNDQVVKNIQTQGAVGRKSMVDAQEINVEHIAESQRIQREQLEKRQQLQTESDYLQTHQINIQTDVAKTAATSLGTMGSGGGGGEGGGGIVGAAMSLGVGLPVGAAFGQQILGNMQKSGILGGAGGGTSGACSHCNTLLQTGAKFCPACGTPVATTPAPSPASAPASSLQIHIARSKQPLGIFNIQEVNRKIGLGEFNRTDLAWYVGQAQWQPLPTISGVVFPPEIPSDTPPPL